MTLANIPTVGKLNETAQPYGGEKKDPMEVEGNVGMYEEDPMPEEPSAVEGDEELDLGDEMGDMEAGGDDREARFEEAIMTLAELAGIEIDTGGGEAAGGVEMDADGEEEEEEEEGGEDEEEQDEVEENMEIEDEPPSAVMQEAKLVDTVLARVTARLVAEAKKKKADAAAAKKKADMKKKAAEMKKKKGEKEPKKLEEANAPAPKSTMSNASKAGVAKAAGKADKGTWGVSSKVQDMEWKEGKGKGGHEMSTESASAEHIVSHGKKNLATQGGNKSK